MSMRRFRVPRLLSAIGLLAAISATAAAQSLGELAKKEQARRNAVKSSGKVLTNDSLASGPRSSVPPSASGQSPSAVPSPAGDASVPAAATAEKPQPESTQQSEKAWRERMNGARDALQRLQMFADALQSQINGLTADFTARDDPAQRAVVADRRQKALAELDRVKNDIVQQTKAIADIQSEARRAGVPPGWLR
jgi:hypothetical protein